VTPEEEKAAKEAADKIKDEAEKKLKEAQEAREKAEKELKDLKGAEDKLKREKAEKELKDKGDYEGLIKKVEAERAALAEQSKKSAIDNALARLAIKAGLKKDSYLGLLDRAAITFEDGNVVGADKAFEKFQKENPDLFGETTEDGGASGGSGRTPKKTSEKTLVDDVLKDIENSRKPRFPQGWPTK